MCFNALLFFVKFPEPGRVKTRLAQAVGDEAAASLYRSLVETNLKELDSFGRKETDLIITFDPPERETEIRAWLPSYPHYLAQQGNGLGERLSHAFHEAFKRGYERAMAFGSDTIGCESGIISQGFTLLEDYDAVIGPAGDGGYYLLGRSGEHPFLFQDIPWSSSLVLKTTLDRIKKRNLHYRLLPQREDLDDIKNLTQFPIPEFLKISEGG